ncbi:barstar family protein [Streptomyces nojiriensis]|uniref:barstar family protein n=1 Tax=Streptomyces nojiriensis TaxID=66374 RepID=UPI0036DD7EF4
MTTIRPSGRFGDRKMESRWSPSPPWVHHVIAQEAAAALRAIPGDALAFELRGSLMTDHDGLFDEFSRQMSFPQYFGRNWPALQDCLDDLTWMPAASSYLLVIHEWPRVLSECEVDRLVLERILHDVGSMRAQGPAAMVVPLNTLLVSE